MSTKLAGRSKQMRIALVMLDQNYGGMQQAFLNYSIELSKRGFPVLCVIRNESVVENKLRKVGIPSIAVINNRIGFHDSFAICQIGEALDEIFYCPLPHTLQSFGSHSTLFASKLKSQVRRWPLIASLHNSVNHKYFKGADILVPSTNQMANANYHTNLVDPVFSEVDSMLLACRACLRSYLAIKNYKNICCWQICKEKRI